MIIFKKMSYESFCAWKVTNRYELLESNIFHAVTHPSFDVNLTVRHYFEEVRDPIIQLKKLQKLHAEYELKKHGLIPFKWFFYEKYNKEKYRHCVEFYCHDLEFLKNNYFSELWG